MKLKVVIIGVSYSSRLALARAVGLLDCEITIVCWGEAASQKKPIDGYSKYVKKVLVCPKEESAFIRLLKEKCKDENQKVILIPDCDFSVSVIDSHQKELSPFFLMPHIHHTQGAIVEWSEKQRQKDLASQLGMNVAKSTIVEIKDGCYDIPGTIQYPCFPKVLASFAGGKAGMFRCDNQQNLEEAFQDIIKRKTRSTKVMVEDYMEIDKEYAVLGFSDGKDVCIPGVIQFVVGSRTQKGIALQGIIKPVDGFESIINRFKVFVLRVGLFGLFDIDFYESQGRLYFSELNIRYGGSGYAVVKMGVNLPAMYVKSIIGKGINDFNKSVEATAVYTNERMCYNDLTNGFISPGEYNHFINSSDILFIDDNEDKKPYNAFKKTVYKAKLKYWPSKVRKWIMK